MESEITNSLFNSENTNNLSNISDESLLNILNSEKYDNSSIEQDSDINIKKLIKPLNKLSFSEILVQMKDTWFGILDDILTGNISINIIMKDTRLFYIGLTIIILAFIFYIYDIIFSKNNLISDLGDLSGIVEIRHIYEPKK
jgi:hypothetical protein